MYLRSAALRSRESLLTKYVTSAVAMDSARPDLLLHLHENDSPHPPLRHSCSLRRHHDLLVCRLHRSCRRHRRLGQLRCLWCPCRCGSFRRLPLVSRNPQEAYMVREDRRVTFIES